MPSSLLTQFSAVLGSHAFLGLLGLVSLPFIARNLGPELYGHFSLFLILLAVVAALDFVRPLFIHRFANSGNKDSQDLRALATINLWLGTIGAAILGTLLLEAKAAA